MKTVKIAILGMLVGLCSLAGSVQGSSHAEWKEHYLDLIEDAGVWINYENFPDWYEHYVKGLIKSFYVAEFHKNLDVTKNPFTVMDFPMAHYVVAYNRADGTFNSIFFKQYNMKDIRFSEDIVKRPVNGIDKYGKWYRDIPKTKNFSQYRDEKIAEYQKDLIEYDRVENNYGPLPQIGYKKSTIWKHHSLINKRWESNSSSVGSLESYEADGIYYTVHNGVITSITKIKR